MVIIMVAAHTLTFDPAKYGDGLIQDSLTVSPLIVAYSAYCISHFPFQDSRTDLKIMMFLRKNVWICWAEMPLGLWVAQGYCGM